ncbi:hypothetical protein B5M09_006013 [Aphanomyces astaci]|uniref:Uncharacterized protein n=1 Tax=Aphanomyces astaci TaxID=112090 RepID=A0A3R7W028_APHAT|nr:hypothetical protein B5M09_006013 [Aphanomyces astaci]
MPTSVGSSRRSTSAPVALEVWTCPELTALIFQFQQGVPGSFLPLAQSLHMYRQCPPLLMDSFGVWMSCHTLDDLKRFCRLCLHLVSAPVMDQAAAMGHLPALMLLHTLGVDCSSRAMNLAAKEGHLDVVTFLHAHRSEGATTSAMNWAAEYGHFEVVQFLHRHRTEGCTKGAMTRAAKAGHLNIVEFLHFHRNEGGYRDMLHGAVAAGHVHVVDFLTSYRKEEPCSPLAMDDAARLGHLTMVQYLHSHRFEAANGHAKVVQYLLSNKSHHVLKPALALTSSAAAGQLKIVQKLSPFVDAKACRDAVVAAAKHNHFDILEWFHQERPDVVDKVRRKLYIQGDTSNVSTALARVAASIAQDQ